MKLFAIFAKPDFDANHNEALPIRVIAQKFSWYAFLLTPIWAIHRRLFKALMIWLVAVLALLALTSVLPFEVFWPLLLLGFWFGLEAPNFEADTAIGKGEVETSFVLADNQLEAEMLAMNVVEEAPSR